MGKSLEDIQRELAAPFDINDVKYRIQALSGDQALMLPYCDARAIQDRLDSVLGMDNWRDEYSEWQPIRVALNPEASAHVANYTGTLNMKTMASFTSNYYTKAVKCTLSIRIGKEWITKEGIADNTSIESHKGGESQALRRAAVKFGLARYLYNLPDQWIQVSADRNLGTERVYYNSTNYYYNKPNLAQYVTSTQTSTKEKITGSNGGGNQDGNTGNSSQGGNSNQGGNQNQNTGSQDSTGGPAPAVSSAEVRDWQSRLAPLAQNSNEAKKMLTDSNTVNNSMDKVSKLLGCCWHLYGQGNADSKGVEDVKGTNNLPEMVKHLKSCIMDLENRAKK